MTTPIAVGPAGMAQANEQVTEGGVKVNRQEVVIGDPIAGSAVATVAQFHNADNQAPGAAAYGLLTGGVAQLLNAAGNIDRQRETGVDGIPAVGVATGTAQFAMAFKTTDSTDNFAAGTRTFTPAAMSGTIGGVAWSIQVGSVLVLDSGANQETVVVTAVTGTTFTCVTAKAHNGTGTAFPITGFVYNQERDAAGETDSASGIGTAVAAEFEYNAGDPSGGNFDRARNLQGKGLTIQTISAGGGQGTKSLTLAANTGLKAGMKVLLYTNAGGILGSAEVVNVDLSYVEGTNTVPLASATVNATTYDRIAYDSFATLGPQLNGFLPFGVGIEEEALFDPVTGKLFIARAATADTMAPQNIPAEAVALWNGASMDRAPGDKTNGMFVNIKGAASKVKFRNLNATVQSIKTSAGTLYLVHIVNNQGATAFIQIFDVLAGSVVLGTTTPDWEFQVPANTTLILAMPTQGVAFATAITIASTTLEQGSVGSANGVQAFAAFA